MIVLLSRFKIISNTSHFLVRPPVIKAAAAAAAAVMTSSSTLLNNNNNNSNNNRTFASSSSTKTDGSISVADTSSSLSSYGLYMRSTVTDALQYSGYSAIDFTISEDAMVYDAVQKFAAFNIGALVTVDSAGNMTGVVSERDYICKVALLGRTSKETKIKEISTRGANVITATSNESVELCMEKMMNHTIRHLPIIDDNKNKKVIGMVSIKDLVKTVVKEKENTIKVLSDFALGKGGHFTAD